MPSRRAISSASPFRASFEGALNASSAVQLAQPPLIGFLKQNAATAPAASFAEREDRGPRELKYFSMKHRFCIFISLLSGQPLNRTLMAALTSPAPLISSQGFYVPGWLFGEPPPTFLLDHAIERTSECLSRLRYVIHVQSLTRFLPIRPHARIPEGPGHTRSTPYL